MYIRKIGGFSLIALVLALPGLATAADTVVASKSYADTKVSIAQGAENANKVLVTNASGDVEPATLGATNVPDLSDTYVTKAQGSTNANKVLVTDANGNVITNTLSASDIVGLTDGLDNKQTKPASVANGKVLTYTGTDANTSMVAQYIQVPVAAGAPSTNTPTGFSEIWLQ